MILYYGFDFEQIFYPYRYYKDGKTHGYYPTWKSFLLEFLGSFIIMWIYCAVDTHRKRSSEYTALMVGATFLALYITLENYSLCGLHPFRTLSGGIVTGYIFEVAKFFKYGNYLWIIAPFLGSALAAVIYKFIVIPTFEGKEDSDKDGQEAHPSELL